MITQTQPNTVTATSMLALFGMALTAFASAGEPVKGVNVSIGREPPGMIDHGAPDIPEVPADFFFSGSAPYSDTTDICDGLDDDCDDTWTLTFTPTDTNHYPVTGADFSYRTIMPISGGTTAADSWTRHAYYHSNRDSDDDNFDFCCDEGTMVTGGMPGSETIESLSMNIPLSVQFAEPGQPLPDPSNPFLTTAITLELTNTPIALERAVDGTLQVPNGTQLTFASAAGGFTFSGTASPVPEPSALGLIGCALFGLLVSEQRCVSA